MFELEKGSMSVCQRGFICSICSKVANSLLVYQLGPDARVLRSGFLGEMDASVPSEGRDTLLHAMSSDNICSLHTYNLELVPCYCPTCNAVYCSEHWHCWDVFDDDADDDSHDDEDDGSMWHDCIRGRCPHGHVRMLQD